CGHLFSEGSTAIVSFRSCPLENTSSNTIAHRHRERGKDITGEMKNNNDETAGGSEITSDYRNRLSTVSRLFLLGKERARCRLAAVNSLARTERGSGRPRVGTDDRTQHETMGCRQLNFLFDKCGKKVYIIDLL
ncbi:MAG: hypothetical protein J7M24_05835, partial [Candidatus Latescibacteria bacterium]|nr:hypothetical protein [Candidatus Latescibacterota bacterium]